MFLFILSANLAQNISHVMEILLGLCANIFVPGPALLGRTEKQDQCHGKLGARRDWRRRRNYIEYISSVRVKE